MFNHISWPSCELKKAQWSIFKNNVSLFVNIINIFKKNHPNGQSSFFSHLIRIRDWWYNVIKVASWRKYIQSRLELFKNKSTYSVWSFDNLLNTSMSICVIRLLSSHLQWYTDIKKLLQLHLQCTKNTEIQILVINI